MLEIAYFIDPTLGIKLINSPQFYLEQTQPESATHNKNVVTFNNGHFLVSMCYIINGIFFQSTELTK